MSQRSIIQYVRMPGSTYMLIGLASCALYGALFAYGFFATDPDSGWHTTWEILLVLTGAIAVEAALCFVAMKVQEIFWPESAIEVDIQVIVPPLSQS